MTQDQKTIIGAIVLIAVGVVMLLSNKEHAAIDPGDALQRVPPTESPSSAAVTDAQAKQQQREPSPVVAPHPKTEAKQLANQKSSQEQFPSVGKTPLARDAADALQLSVGKGFSSVGFKLAATSQSLNLYDEPDHLFKQLPRFQGQKQQYGRLELANGQHYRFVLDMANSGYLLYLDKNLNGNLRDDGAPIKNQGTGLFAATISLPLSEVTGMREFYGDYKLWVFTNKTAIRQHRLKYYPKTHLSGVIKLAGRSYQAYLTDNQMIDGDYCNDGIYVDIDDDGKIVRSSEYFPSGAPIRINDQHYPIKLICTSN